MKVWITKYALTAGIQETDVEECKTTGMVHETRPDYPSYFHGEGREWHRTEDGARKRANEMVQKKIKSLKTSLKKFGKLVF